MNFANRKIVEQLCEQYPIGARVKLVKMDDIQAPPIGSLGTVRGVDDMGSIMVSWDNGGSLSVIYGVDKCKRVFPFKIICYGQETTWYSRRKAKELYLKAILSTEGNEQSRYVKIYDEISEGFDVCSDE